MCKVSFEVTFIATTEEREVQTKGRVQDYGVSGRARQTETVHDVSWSTNAVLCGNCASMQVPFTVGAMLWKWGGSEQ